QTKWFEWWATPMRSTSGYRTLNSTTSPPDTPSPPPRLLQKVGEGAGTSLRIAAVEDRRARDEDVRALFAERHDVVGADAAVHFDSCLDPRFVQVLSERADLRHDRGNETLPAEPRIHRHQEHIVEV